MDDKLGPTGNYPRGKFSDNDDGELRIRMGIKDKTFIIEFGCPVGWIGFDPQHLVEFINQLRQYVPQKTSGEKAAIMRKLLLESRCALVADNAPSLVLAELYDLVNKEQ